MQGERPVGSARGESDDLPAISSAAGNEMDSDIKRHRISPRLFFSKRFLQDPLRSEHREVGPALELANDYAELLRRDAERCGALFDLPFM